MVYAFVAIGPINPNGALSNVALQWLAHATRNKVTHRRVRCRPLLGAPFLASNLCGFCDVFACHQYQLISRPGPPTLTIGLVLIALVESYCSIPRGPLKDEIYLRGLPLTFERFDVGGARQVSAAARFNHFRHFLDVSRNPTLVNYVQLCNAVTLHAVPLKLLNGQ
jgi:hypothetical protein